MVKATDGFSGMLLEIPNCYIQIPGYGPLYFYALPEVTDNKPAIYNSEPVIGRAVPITTYSHSDNRKISFTIHLYVTTPMDIQRNVLILRALQSLTYPTGGTKSLPYTPPPICKMKCGSMLGDDGLCCVLENYNLNLPTDCVWDTVVFEGSAGETLMPYRLDVQTNWIAVYQSTDLPTQDRIMKSGR